nr:hypothetical protein [uncultured Flavobacterium sp.]
MTKTYLVPSSVTDLFSQAHTLELYEALLLQVTKDFRLANIELDIKQDEIPEIVFNKTQDKVFSLIQHDFATYLNLLYIIDVSEDQIKKLDGSNIVELSNIITFLILKREWQKVWFKKHY